MMNIDTSGSAADLRSLADQIENTVAIGYFTSDFRLENLQDEECTAPFISSVTDWEREVRDARCLYSFSVSDIDLSIRGVWSPAVRKRTRTIKYCLLNRLIDNVVYELPKIDIKDSYVALISASKMFLFIRQLRPSVRFRAAGPQTPKSNYNSNFNRFAGDEFAP